MEDSPYQRAIWRSALLNAASHQPSDIPAKLPLGREHWRALHEIENVTAETATHEL